jgi:hypothetical protein
VLAVVVSAIGLLRRQRRARKCVHNRVLYHRSLAGLKGEKFRGVRKKKKSLSSPSPSLFLFTCRPQTSFAYSWIVRSDENLPIHAVDIIDIFAHFGKLR